MNQLWDEPPFRDDFNELELKTFTLLQSVNTKAFLEAQRKQQVEYMEIV